MKYYLFLFILLFNQLTGQIIKPQFEFKLYVQDAKGNKDSVVIAYDKNAKDTLVFNEKGFRSLGGINTRYGDDDLSSIPLHKELDMRLHRVISIHRAFPTGFSDNSVSITTLKNFGYTKHLTLNVEHRDDCSTTRPIQEGNFKECHIIVKAKYPPIKFTWDKDFFNLEKNRCVKSSYFVTNLPDYDLSDPPFIAHKYFAKRTEWIDSLKEDGRFSRREGTNQHILLRNEKNTVIDTFNANYLFMFDPFLLTDVDDIEELVDHIYPNPSSNFINLSLRNLADISSVKIYNLQGQMVKEIDSDLDHELLQIDVSTLSSGIHFVEIKSSQKRYMASFYKE